MRSYEYVHGCLRVTVGKWFYFGATSSRNWRLETGRLMADQMKHRRFPKVWLRKACR